MKAEIKKWCDDRGLTAMDKEKLSELIEREIKEMSERSKIQDEYIRFLGEVADRYTFLKLSHPHLYQVTGEDIEKGRNFRKTLN